MNSRPDMWKVVLDSSGHHRAVYCGQQLESGEKTIDFGPHKYHEACGIADDLNTVAEVTQS